MRYTGILCGNFSTRGMKLTPSQHNALWQHIVKNNEERSLGHHFYYSKFYDVCYGDKSQGIDGFDRYEYTPEQGELHLVFGSKSYDLRVERLGIYLCPFNIALYSIMVTMETEESNDITFVMSKLRDIMSFQTNEPIKPFVTLAVDPIKEFCAELSTNNSEFEHMLIYGNKLKLFQIIEFEETETNNRNMDDVLLYEFGTLSLVANHDMTAPDAPSADYFEQIIQNNTVSIYNNWKALSLFDTFTMMGWNISQSSRNNWIDNYSGMIYLYGLFVKVYLFELNNNYNSEKSGRDRSMISETYDEFETKYYFIDISYNILPRMVNTHIFKALEIAPEKCRLYERIERQNMLHEKKADSKMNRLLFAMTNLTLMSAIWDGACLLNEVYPYSEHFSSSVIGFRTIILIFALLIAIGFSLIYRGRRKS